MDVNDGKGSGRGYNLWNIGDLLVSPSKMRATLETFYQIYNPEKISTIDNILETYSCREKLLFEQLCDKYNVDELTFRRIMEDSLETLDEDNIDGQMEPDDASTDAMSVKMDSLESENKTLFRSNQQLMSQVVDM
jgi:hypothetical protein